MQGVSVSSVSSRLLGPRGTEVSGVDGGFGIRCLHYTAQPNRRNSKTSQIITTMNCEYQNCQSWMRFTMTIIQESICKWMTV
jgi:hypothetical protein